MTVTLDVKELVRKTDFAISYRDNVDAGTATVKVTGRGCHKGSAKATFEIVPACLDGATVTAGRQPLEHTGGAVRPKVTVTLDGERLERGADYAVSYAGNETIGTATVKVTGRGNYEGTATTTFEIVPQRVSLRKVTASGKGVAAEWKAQDGVDGYQVQYADDSAFTKVKTPFIVVGALSTRASVPERAKDSATYVRVRAFKDALGKRLYSSWSAPKKAKRKWTGFIRYVRGRPFRFESP